MPKIQDFVAEMILKHKVPTEAMGHVFIRLLGALRKRGWITPGEVNVKFAEQRLRLELKHYRFVEKASRIKQRMEDD